MNGTVIGQRRKNLGSFEVGRVLPAPERHMVGPFIFFDHLGPVELPRGLSREADVRPHPHIGLATVTYLFAGEIVHRDSTGIEQAIRPAEVNWMTAGRGITHSERFEQARRVGGPLHAVQAWVALPTEAEEVAPSFAHHSAEELPVAASSGVQLRVLAGEAFGCRSPVLTYSPLFYAHATLEAGASLDLPHEHSERAVYLVAGAVSVDRTSLGVGQLCVLETTRAARVTAQARSVLMLLGGEPVGDRYIEWNFVSSSKARIEQAKADWRAGRMKLPEADSAEFIPLPGEPPPAAGPMS